MIRIREAWEVFQPFLDRDAPPPLSEGDTLLRSDATWSQAAEAYAGAKRHADEATKQLESARQVLIELAQHPKEQGAGVSVTRFWKQGSVDYKKVPELIGVDLERYRKRATEEVRVTVAA